MDGLLEAVVPLIVVLFFILGGLKKALEAAGQAQQRAKGRAGGDFEASPEEVQEFLRGLEAAHGKPAAEPPEDRPGRQAAEPVRERKRPQPLWEAAGEAEPATSVSARQATIARARRARRARPREDRKSIVPKPAAETADQSVPAEAAVAPAALKKFGLRQAVVWSEILGPPVSRRRVPGHRPPGLGNGPA